MQQLKPRIIISGGGTGGHVFPAIAIADSIREQYPGVAFLFVGALGKMEMQKVPAAGYQIEGLPITGFQRRITIKNLSFPFKLVKSMLKAGKLIKDFDPDLAIGTGGYASGPTLRAAAKKGVPCLIQEQNSFPGVTNRLLAKSVQKICVAYEGLEQYFPQDKIIITGNPVRKDLLELGNKKAIAQKTFGLEEGKTCVLVMGGSQGARGINQAIKENLEQIAGLNIQFIWQSGQHFYQEALKAVRGKYERNIRVVEFISEMDLAYAAADILISRAGAIAISELCIVGKPCIFVPLPTAAEDHQTKNAMALVEKKAALLVNNKDAVKLLVKELSALIRNKDLQKSLAENIKKLARPEAARTIANEAIKLMK